MADNNFVLFKRDSQDSQEDVWDDSALIQAYDKAVNLAKEKLAARLGSTEEGSIHNGEKDSTSNKSLNKQDWKVGDYVRSIYSEDGIVYEAIIEKIIPTTSSCLIKYLGYDNEEEKLLKDLQPSGGPTVRRQQILASTEGITSSDDMECEASCSSTQQPSKGIPSAANLQWQPVKPAPPPTKSFPKTAVPSSPFMSMPPPPPPAAWPSSTDDSEDSDSLYSMLMSWYMAGYHTGYYQGAQQKGHGSK